MRCGARRLLAGLGGALAAAATSTAIAAAIFGTGTLNNKYSYAYEEAAAYMYFTGAPPKDQADSKRNQNQNRCRIPQLPEGGPGTQTFLQRLDALLPVPNANANATSSSGSSSSSSPCRLFVEEIEAVEEQLLRFRIPSPGATVQIPDREYINIQAFRWMFRDQRLAEESESEGEGGNTTTISTSTSTSARRASHNRYRAKCPNCRLHFGTWAGRPGNETTTFPEERVRRFYLNRMPPGQALADLVFDPSCPRGLPRDGSVAANAANRSAQVLVGGCGESQAGSGRAYATAGRRHFDHHSGFQDMRDGSPFVTTYAHAHFAPNDDRVAAGTEGPRGDRDLGLPELWTVADFARQLLAPPKFPRYRPEVHGKASGTTAINATATFVHNNCQGIRGNLVRLMAAIEPKRTGTMRIARYGKCLHNAELPEFLKQFNDPPCAGKPRELLFHHDCEGTRDVTKTLAAALHDFTFSLENTLSEDYFTEKRWQALLAGSVPIVWNNHNSLDFLPDPDAALVVDTADAGRPGIMQARAEALMDDLVRYSTNRTAYMQFFAWKARGLTPSFVRKLFLSTDYQICRMCEFVAQNKKVQ